MSEKKFERLIKSIDKEVMPPQGLKEEMLVKILKHGKNEIPDISKIERLIFESHLRAACVLSAAVSGIMWAVVGKGYTGIFYILTGMR